MEIKKNVILSSFTTFGIGGTAELFCVVKNKEELLEALEYAKTNNIPYHILGGGSNVLIPDNGISGLVIKNAANNIKYDIDRVYVESGASLAYLVADTIKNEYGGLEFASGIPGTVGGAIVGNAGAYGNSISERLISATVYNGGRIENWNNSDFDFKYRFSKIKGNHGLVVIDAVLKLENSLSEQCFAQIKEDNRRRANSYFGRNVGSYFKNILTKDLGEKELSLAKDCIVHDKVVAAKLIENLGLKGFRCGGVEISKRHANVVNNVAHGTAADVEKLEKEIIKKVYENYNIKLEPEVVKL